MITERTGHSSQRPCPQAGWRLLLCPHSHSHQPVCRTYPAQLLSPPPLQTSSWGGHGVLDVSPVVLLSRCSGGWNTPEPQVAPDAGGTSIPCLYLVPRKDSASINSEQPGAEGPSAKLPAPRSRPSEQRKAQLMTSLCRMPVPGHFEARKKS